MQCAQLHYHWWFTNKVIFTFLTKLTTLSTQKQTAQKLKGKCQSLFFWQEKLQELCFLRSIRNHVSSTTFIIQKTWWFICMFLEKHKKSCLINYIDHAKHMATSSNTNNHYQLCQVQGKMCNFSPTPIFHSYMCISSYS